MDGDAGGDPRREPVVLEQSQVCGSAAHIGQKVTGWAFVVFTVSSLLWVWFAAAEDDHGLLVQNLVLTAINLLGVYRYLIRGKRA